MKDAGPEMMSIFCGALEQPPGEDRSAYLGAACGEDPALRVRIESLLKAHEEAAGAPPAKFGIAGLSATTDPPFADLAGTAIGPYKLLEQIGEGGFGVVFMAEQAHPVRRKVALKILKPGMDTKQVVARFEAERQALALMDHPNIARVFDAGETASGRPYFVMELVRGVPITDFCDQNQMTPRQRLELFLSVCRAVQHAHQKGVIHRDLKPSNILVASHDGTPAAKVIDFGVAKAAGPALTDKTLFTGFAQLVGTPLYMSPEQAAQSPDVDTRTDIYALGVLLYELLTGTTPFDKERFKQAAYDEIRRIIREEDPPRPSTRLAQSTETLPSVSNLRQTEPARLTRLVRGELDWIVMKALEKDRNRRYESAAAFAADVQRYLDDEPVQACPPSVGYKLRKFVRRNRTSVAAGTSVCLALLVAVGGLAVSYTRVRDVLDHEQQALYFQRVKTATRELAAGNQGRAERSLDECPADRRGWEWHYLKRRRYQDPAALEAPDAALTAVYSPDGRYLATGCVDGSLAVWDTWTWKLVPLPRGHKGHVYAVAFSSDGRYLASGGNDQIVLVWDLSTGAVVYRLTEHTGIIRQLAFGPEGRLASAAEDGTVRLWDLATGTQTRAFDGHQEPVRGVAFTAGGQVVSAGASGEVKVWDPATGAVSSSRRGSTHWVSVMALHAPSGRVALAGGDGTVELWDGPAARETRALDGHSTHVTGLAFSPDGSRLASAGDDRAIKLWDTRSGHEALSLDVGGLTPIGVAFGPDGGQLAIACGQRQVKICDGTPLSGTEKTGELLTLNGHTDMVLRVAFDPKSGRLVSSSRDGTARVWDARTGQELLTFRKHAGIVSAAVFGLDGGWVASAGWDGRVMVWDAVTEDVLYELDSSDAGPAYDVAVSPDGGLIASAHATGFVILWDARSRARLHRIRAHGYEAVSVAFDNNGKRFVTAGGRDHSASVWDSKTAERMPLNLDATDRASSRTRHAVFSPDGQSLATVGHGNVKPSCVMIWDAATGNHVQTIEGPGRRLFHAAFSPDSWSIAACGQDELVRIWDLKKGGEPHVLRGHAGELQCVAFSPDGRLLASCGGYKGRGEIKVWDAARWKKN